MGRHHPTSSQLSPRRPTLLLLLLLPLLLYLYIHPPPILHPKTNLLTPHPTSPWITTALQNLTHETSHYKLLSETITYSTPHARVYSRTIQYPTNKSYTFDIWGRAYHDDSFQVVIIIPFDIKTKTFLLVKEYCVACNHMMFSFPAGVYEKGKHGGSVRIGAGMELREEGGVECEGGSGGLIRLMEGDGDEEGKGGAFQDKYQRERVEFFLCVGFVGRERGVLDEEERIQVVEGVSVVELRELVLRGTMQVNMMAGAFMAIDQLRLMGLVE